MENQCSEILIPLIRKHIAKGSIIHSWHAYDDLQNENYIHRTVNYSANFADSKGFAHQI